MLKTFVNSITCKLKAPSSRVAFSMGLFLCFAAMTCHADTLILKSGETLKGAWERVQSGNIVFKSDTLGEVTVPAGKVQSITTTVPAVAILKNGRTVKGQLELSPKGEWVLAPAAGNAATPLAAYTIIFPRAAYNEFRKTATAKPWRNWKGSANAGYGLQTGDTQASTLTATVNATRKQPDIVGVAEKWRTNFFLTSLLAHTKDNLTGASVTSNTFSTGLRQDRFLTSADFLFVFGQFDHIQPEGISSRVTAGGGFGRDLIHTTRLSVSGLGGLTFVNTNFIGSITPSERSAEVLVGERVSAQLTKFLHLDHQLNFYPNISQTGQYRFDTATTLSVPLKKKLSFQVSYIDFYLTTPAAGSHNNNATFSTGIGYNF
ncbi:MAG TPA: DUF481 domain-containing protein [Terriglobia bacterium]|nr:DUF481 domain-containing protein [Terriglobia bacterium]